MGNLPLLEKNASFATYVSPSCVFSHLGYSHYDAKRSYFLTERSGYSGVYKKFVSSFGYNLLALYSAFEKKHDWHFLNDSCEGVSDSIYEIEPFQDEGKGIHTLRANVSSYVSDVSTLVGRMRERVPGMNINVLTPNDVKLRLSSLAKQLQYEELFLLDMNLLRFDIYSVKETGEKQKLTHLNKYGYDGLHIKQHWSKKQSLVDQIRSSKLQAFLLTDLKSESVVNKWANFIHNPTHITSSSVLSDLIRGYITVQLLSFYNEHLDMFKGLGKIGKKNGIIVCGDLVNLISEREMLTCVLDGLQLEGIADLIIDRESLFYTFGKNLAEGVNSSELIVSRKDVFPEILKIMVPKLSKKTRQVVFSGTENKEGEIKSVYALSPDLTIINIDAESDFKGEFIKGAKLGENSVEITDESDEVCSKVVIDGRFKPVVYGPDVRTNRRNISYWYSE